MIVTCCIWGFLETRPLLVKKARSQNMRYRSLILCNFLPLNSHGVYNCEAVKYKLYSSKAKKLHIHSFMADVTCTKCLRDLSAQRRLVIRRERKDKTEKKLTGSPIMPPSVLILSLPKWQEHSLEILVRFSVSTFSPFCPYPNAKSVPSKSVQVSGGFHIFQKHQMQW